MCGPTFEVNIQCLLPVLPAVSHHLNFVLSWMRPYSNWAHLNCLFLILNKQNIALRPQLNLISHSKDRGANVLYVVLWKTIKIMEVNIFKNKRKRTKCLSFSELCIWILLFRQAFPPWVNLSQGQIQVVYWFSEWFTELVYKASEFVLTAVIRVANVANVMHWIA